MTAQNNQKEIFLVGDYFGREPLRCNPTHLLQAQSLGFIKRAGTMIPVIDIHETAKGFQIEVGKPVPL